MALSGDTTVKEPSEELGTKDSTFRRWAQEYESTGDGAFPGNGRKAREVLGVSKSGHCEFLGRRKPNARIERGGLWGGS